MRQTGLPVKLTTTGEPQQLPAGSSSSAYRIIQGGATNTSSTPVLHRPPVSPRRHRGVEVEVVDDGQPATARQETGGKGLVGACKSGVPVRRPPRGRGPSRWRLPVYAVLRARIATIAVVLADDQALVRRGFRLILETEPGIEVVAEAEDGQQAVDAVRRHRPAVVLMDIQMPGLDGLEATRRILGQGSNQTRVLILTTFERDDVFEALQVGASGFLLKTAPPEDLLTAVRVVSQGEALLSPSVTRRVIQEVTRHQRRAPRSPELDRLTQRELEVLRLLAEGRSNAGVAAKAVPPAGDRQSPHLHCSILSKLGLRDRVQVVIFAEKPRGSQMNLDAVRAVLPEPPQVLSDFEPPPVRGRHARTLWVRPASGLRPGGRRHDWPGFALVTAWRGVSGRKVEPSSTHLARWRLVRRSPGPTQASCICRPPSPWAERSSSRQLHSTPPGRREPARHLGRLPPRPCCPRSGTRAHRTSSVP